MESFIVAEQYLNKRCGLHLKEYQKSNPDNPLQFGIINSKEKFTKCNCRPHITREKYNEIIPKIVDELFNAGFHESLKKFHGTVDINDKYTNLKTSNVNISSITAQKTTDSNTIIKQYQLHLYDVKDSKGVNIATNWTKEKIKDAFKKLDKPNCTVNANFTEFLKKFKFSPVTVYSPIMTKRILEVLDCKTVFDPCIGWGGRMVGTTCIGNSHYTGCEPCVNTFNGLNNIITDLELESQTLIINKPVEEVLDNELKDKRFDCCLTSPPYYDLEIYSDEDTQSINKFPTYKLWLDNFIDPIIKYVTEHVTKYSCWSVKNFKTDKDYPFKDDVVKIHEKYGWVYDREYGITKNTKNGSVFGDITYVFKKGDAAEEDDEEDDEEGILISDGIIEEDNVVEDNVEGNVAEDDVIEDDVIEGNVENIMMTILNNIKYGVQQYMCENTYNNIPLSPQAENLECIVLNALHDAGYPSTGWTPKGIGSHRSGYDFICNELPIYGGEIQMKTGKWNKEYLSLTSSRTTTHKTLESKLIFMDEHKQHNLWSVSVNETDNTIKLSIICGENIFCDKCKASDLELISDNNGNFKFKDINNLRNIKICASTSSQVMYEVHKKSIDYYKVIDLY